MYKSIQAFRGIAALSVVAYHLSISFGDARYFSSQSFSWLTWRMNLGVDFFFVLSGFIIMLAHQKDIGHPESLLRYLKRRFARLYPTYWIYAGIFTFLVALGFGTSAHRPIGVVEWITTFSLVRITNMLTPISPAWTLFHEIGFYASFAAMIAWGRLGVALFIVWQIVCLVLLQYPSEDGRTPFLTYFSAYNTDFAIGMSAYLLSRQASWGAAAFSIAGGSLLLISTIACEAVGISFSAYPLIYALSFGAIIIGSGPAGPLETAMQAPILSALGDASYSIYLTHEAVSGLLLKMAFAVFGSSALHEQLVYPSVLVCTVLLGYVAYLAVEKPTLMFFRRR